MRIDAMARWDWDIDSDSDREKIMQKVGTIHQIIGAYKTTTAIAGVAAAAIQADRLPPYICMRMPVFRIISYAACISKWKRFLIKYDLIAL